MCRDVRELCRAEQSIADSRFHAFHASRWYDLISLARPDRFFTKRLSPSPYTESDKHPVKIAVRPRKAMTLFLVKIFVLIGLQSASWSFRNYILDSPNLTGNYKV